MGNMMGGPPPPPMATQGPNSAPPPFDRGGNNPYGSRPDLNFSRSNYSDRDDGISLRENFTRPELDERNIGQRRPEMKGPSDISDILSGLKTKTINIQEPSQSAGQPTVNDSSTISISDLKELQSDGNMPKRTRRKQRSDKNTVSLDI
jgi:hypothetical protein